MLYAIFPPEELVEDAAVALPLSKSISTRCMVLDALTESAPDNSASIAVCDDTAVIADALAAWRGAPAGAALTLDMKASGAALRFLTAFFAATPGADVTLTGIPRLLERPMGILVDALRACGAEIDYTGVRATSHYWPSARWGRGDRRLHRKLAVHLGAPYGRSDHAPRSDNQLRR